MKLFGKKNGKTAVFTDFDHMYEALGNIYGRHPDTAEFQQIIRAKYDVVRFAFYGNFINPELQKETDAIRGAGGEVVDTRDPDNYRKDRTDLIMLDQIYQTAAADKSVETFVIFTADDQFISPFTFLRTRLGKKVVLSGVRGCLSARLRGAADEVFEIPEETAERNRYYDMIIDNFRYIYRHKERNIYPTFLSTVTNVARLNEVSEDDVREALQQLIDKKIIYKADVVVNQGENTVRVLRMDKGRAIEAGLYPRD